MWWCMQMSWHTKKEYLQVISSGTADALPHSVASGLAEPFLLLLLLWYNICCLCGQLIVTSH